MMKAAMPEHSRILRRCKDYETLVAAALYLMTRYSQSGNPVLAEAVAAHLAALTDHPDCPNACLAQTVRKLSEEWITMQTGKSAGDAGGLH